MARYVQDSHQNNITRLRQGQSDVIPIAHFNTLVCSPGRYDNHADVKQEIEFHHAFGGKKKLKETARMKCTKGIPEKVNLSQAYQFIIILFSIHCWQCGVCDTVQVGDYYEYREMDELLCSECFYKLRNSKDPMREA